MHQNTLFRTEWQGYIRRWGDIKYHYKEPTAQCVEPGGEWQVIGSSWVLVPGLHPAEPAQVPLHNVTQCSMKRDELW